MHILFISNYYPPAYLGGYEIGCREIADALAARGHEVSVLTSHYKARSVPPEANVYRVLHHDLGPNYPIGRRPLDPASLIGGQWFSPRNFVLARQWAGRLRPDVVYAWCLEHISISPALAARTLGVPRAYYIFDRWPVDVHERYRRSPSALKRRLKGLFVAPVLEWVSFSNAAFASQFLRNRCASEGIRPPKSRVLYHGIKLNEWPPPRERINPEEPWKLLFVGNVYPHKGVHVILEALRRIDRDHRSVLDIVGDGPPSYRRELQKQAEGLTRAEVRFLGRLPRAQLPGVYASHDALLFPSICEEGLGLVVLEAMVSGLPTIISRTGGTVEIVDGAPFPNVCERGDAGGLAERIVGLLGEPRNWRELRAWGIERVRSTFSFEETISATEEFLSALTCRG